SSHATADVNADGGRDDGAPGRDNCADGGAAAVVHIRHDGHVLEHERQGGGVGYLTHGVVIELNAVDPGHCRHTGAVQIKNFHRSVTPCEVDTNHRNGDSSCRASVGLSA